jgi:hypothetical protein
MDMNGIGQPQKNCVQICMDNISLQTVVFPVLLISRNVCAMYTLLASSIILAGYRGSHNKLESSPYL